MPEQNGKISVFQQETRSLKVEIFLLGSLAQIVADGLVAQSQTLKVKRSLTSV